MKGNKCLWLMTYLKELISAGATKEQQGFDDPVVRWGGPL